MEDEYEDYSREELIDRVRALESILKSGEHGINPEAEGWVIERQRARAASEAKDRFLAALSHELRTPLTSVLLAVSELRYEISTSRASYLLGLVSRNVQLEARLIDDLLDVTRITRGKLELRKEPVDCHQILESTLDLCECQILMREHSVSTAFEASRSFVLGDSTRLHQIFWNLVRNAAQHSPPGGAITVKTENRDHFLVVAVIDEGTGIPPELSERLFIPFEQRESPSSSGGLGLGLTIARGLTEAHGGTISVAPAEKQRGTRFEVALPVTRESQRPPPPASTPPRIKKERPRVLLVEDDPDTAELLIQVLERRGYRLQHVPDMQSALDSAGDEFDVVVSDLGLPDGSGHEMLQHLRRTSSAPAIALSGYGGEAEVSRSKAAGFSAHVLKPASPEHLIEIIERVRREGDRA